MQSEKIVRLENNCVPENKVAVKEYDGILEPGMVE